jgi:hypothetical protein
LRRALVSAPCYAVIRHKEHQRHQSFSRKNSLPSIAGSSHFLSFNVTFVPSIQSLVRNVNICFVDALFGIQDLLYSISRQSNQLTNRSTMIIDSDLSKRIQRTVPYSNPPFNFLLLTTTTTSQETHPTRPTCNKHQAIQNTR